MQRILEPEVMDSWEEAIQYDAMNFTEVNVAFAQHAIALGPPSGLVLDAGTGTARIPILICQACPTWQVIAIDLAQNMLRLGTRNLQQTGLSSQIVLELGDAKQLAYADGLFDMVISNSLVHHLPDPLPFLRELQRSLKPNGAILIRDLLRPPDQVTMDVLVARLGSDGSESQKRLFRNSLQAAFTLDEVKQLVQAAGLEETKIYQSSERHWTLERAWGQ